MFASNESFLFVLPLLYTVHTMIYISAVLFTELMQ